MGQQDKRYQTLQDLAESNRKRKKLPQSYKVFQYFFLGYSYFCTILYTVGAMNFGADIVDSFFRWSVGFTGLIGIGMVVIGYWIYENQN